MPSVRKVQQIAREFKCALIQRDGKYNTVRDVRYFVVGGGAGVDEGAEGGVAGVSGELPPNEPAI